MRGVKKAALGFILLGLLASAARAAEYDPFDRDPAEVLVSETLRPRLYSVYTEVMPLLGATCLVPREPSQVADGLTRLLAEFPAEPGLYLERARAYYTLGRFDEAEKDFRAYADEAADPGTAIRALADFYGDRLMIKEQMAALDRLFEALAREPKKNKKAIAAAIDEIFSVSAAQGLKIDRAAYRRKMLDLFPDDLDATLDFLNERAASAPLDDAVSDILAYAQKFPDHPEPFLTLQARLLRKNGRNDEARRVFLDGLVPDSAPSLFNAFFSLLRDWDEYGDFKSELESREGDWSDQDHAILFHLHLEAGDDADAARVVDEWMAAEKSPPPGRVMMWADYDMRCARAEKAAVLVYGGLQRVSGEERGLWLWSLFRALMESRSAALPYPGSVAGLYDPRALDPDPGISGGVFSLLLSGRDMGEVLADLAEMDARHHNFSLALEVRDEYRKSFAQGKLLADMDFEVVVRLTELGAWSKAADEAAAFASAHPDDPGVAEALLARARALWKLGRKDEARKQFDDLLDTSESGGEFYLDTLGEYASYLLDDGRGGEMVGLYWREIGKHQDQPETYKAFLDSISNMELGDEELKIYRQAAEKLKGADWYSRLARFYLRKKMSGQYQQSLTDAVSRLPEPEIAELVNRVVPEWPRNDKTIAFKASLYLMAARRYPRNPEYMRSYIRLASLVYNQGSCADASCRDPLLDFTKHCLMDDHRAGKEAGRALLGRLMARGLLDDAVNALLKKNSPNAAEDYFLALAQDAQGRYEQSVEFWRRASERWPGTPYFQEETAARLFGLEKVRPGRFPDAWGRALKLLTGLNALYPADRDYPVHLGEALAGEGRFEEALSWWDHLLSQAPGESGSYLAAAETAWDYFQYQAAADRIRLARTRLDSPDLFALELGAVLEDAGDCGAAVTEYVQALSGETTDSYRVVTRLMDLAKERGQSAAIEAAFNSRIALRPSDARVARARADYLERMGREGEIGKMLAAAAGRIADVEFLRWARETAHRLGPPEAEEEALTRWRELRPNDFEARLLLVRFYHGRGRTQDMLAAADAMKAEILKLSRPSARLSWLNSLATELWSDGQHDPALDLLRKALPLAQGEDARAAGLNLASRLIELKEYAEAVAVLDSMLRARGFDAEVFSELAKVHALRSDRNALVESDRRLKAMIDESSLGRREKREQLSALHHTVARALTQAGGGAEALDYFIEWINLAPGEAPRLNEAWAFAGRDDGRGRLVKYYRKLADESGKDYRWPWVLARMLSWQGDADGALASYQAAIRDEPGMAALHQELAALLLGQGDFKRAAETYEKLAAIDPAGEEWRPLAVRMHFLAGEADQAMALVRATAEHGSGHHRYFAAAHALLISGRPAEALPFLHQGLPEFLSRADRDVLSSQDLADYVLIHAESGRLIIALAALDDAAAGLGKMAANPANKFVKWRLDKSRGNIEAAAAGPLARAYRDHGGADDYKALAQRLDGGGSALSAITLFNLAAGAGLPDQAARLLPAALREKENSSSYVFLPGRDQFLRERGAWQELADSPATTPYEKANAWLWLGREQEAASVLAGTYHNHDSLSAGDMEFLDLIVKLGRQDLMRQYLDDGVWVTDEANYLIAGGRPELAERVLRSYRQPAWSVSKQLLLKLDTRDYGAEFNKEAVSLFRLWPIGRRLDTPWSEDKELRGHEQAVMMMKYAELKARGNDLPGAMELWDAGEEDRPGSNRAYRFSAQLLLELGKNEEAKERFNFALQLDPRDNPSRYGAALARLKSGDRDGALAMLEAISGDTAAPGAWETDKKYQFYAMLNCGMEKEAVERLAAWIRNTYGQNRWAAAEALADLARLARGNKSREEIDLVTGLMQEISPTRPDDDYLASRAIGEGWLDPADLGFAYDHMVASLTGKEGREQELKDWEDKRLDYWLAVGRSDDVIKALNSRELGLDPVDVPAADAQRKLRALLQRGKDNEAVSYLAAWQGADLDPVPKLTAAVQAYCREGRANDALELEKKIGTDKLYDPSAPASAYLDLAQVLARLGKAPEAKATLESMIAMKPGDKEALISAAQAAEKHGWNDKAAHYRELASGLDPFDAPNRIAHAHDLYLLGRHDAALTEIQGILADPAVTRGHKHELVRGLTSWLGDQQGKEVAAKWLPALVKEAQAGGLKKEFFPLAAEAVAQRAGDGKAAAKMMESAVSLCPSFTGPAAAEFYLGRKQYDAALDFALAGIKYFPSDARARFVAVQAYLDAGKPERAIAMALAASDLIAAEHMDHQQPEAEASDLLGSDLDLDAKTALVRALAAELARKKLYGSASLLLKSLLDYLEPGNEGEECEECGDDYEALAPPCVLPGEKGPEAGLAGELRGELKRLSKLEQDQARSDEQRLTIQTGLDNGLDWSWLMPELESPESVYLAR
ncbi:MAG TPA: tetratricopeptide repeat protein [bacterium]|nr:tetratricopeptide repeat protein [bacterium]